MQNVNVVFSTKYNRQTVIPKPRRSLFNVVRELIGGPQRQTRTVLQSASIIPTYDAGKGDYAFWDRARRGRAKGLELSGLMLKPLYSHIAAWMLGDTPSFRLDNKTTQENINSWWQTNHPRILKATEESLALGDYFLVINADLSCTLVSPDVVTPIVNEQDFSELIGWRIERVHPHPTKPGRVMTIRDEYTLKERVRTILINGATVSRKAYTNLIGRIPVVHIPNYIFGADSLFGESEGYALIPLMHRYNGTLEVAFKGNQRQGRPTPAIEKMGDAKIVKLFWETYGKRRTVQHNDGTTEVEEYLDFDGDKLLTLGGDAQFGYKSPAPFLGDTQKLLESYFYLYVDHSEMPEGFLGTAIPGSRASLDMQEKPLERFVNKKRSYLTEPILEISRVVQAYYAVIDPTNSTEEEPTVRWPAITSEDDNLRLNTVKYAHTEAEIMDDETALTLLPVEIENPAEVLKKARQEAEERRQQAQDAIDERMAQAEERTAAADKAAQNAIDNLDTEANQNVPDNTKPKRQQKKPAA